MARARCCEMCINAHPRYWTSNLMSVIQFGLSHIKGDYTYGSWLSNRFP